MLLELAVLHSLEREFKDAVRKMVSEPFFI